MDPKWSGRQLSITAKQRQAAAGTELLAMLQSITADGHFTQQELDALHAWLRTNRESGLPGAEFLLETAERVIADGRITDQEWDELFAAVVRVLPPAERPAAQRARNTVEAARVREVLRQEAAERRETAEWHNERNRKLGIWDFMVAGTAYDGRGEVIDSRLDAGDVVVFAREPMNQWDSNAVAVRLVSGEQIGYVPAKYAREIGPLMDGGAAFAAYCKKILLGARASIPVVVAEVASAVSQAAGAAAPSTLAQAQFDLGSWQESVPPSDKSRSVGWLIAAVVIGIVLVRLIAG
jgi:hypothetical protein